MKMSENKEKELTARLDNLDKRLADIQNIVRNKKYNSQEHKELLNRINKIINRLSGKKIENNEEE